MAKILIVDDSGMSRKMLRGILESGGHDVVEAADGMAGLERYSVEKPDLVMLDLMMTGLNGFEVLEMLKNAASDARVVVATADIQTSTAGLCKAAGACGLVTKPFKADQVLDAVCDALGLPGSPRTEEPLKC